MNNKGFSFAEVSIVIAISVILAMAIYPFLLQSGRLVTSTAIVQERDSKNTHDLTWIMNDLRNSHRHTLGSLLMNGGFENSTSGTAPDNWDQNPPPEVKYSNISVANSVHSGAHSLAIEWAGLPVSYSANQIKLLPNTAYMLSGWVRSEGIGTELTIELLNSNNQVLVTTTSQTDRWQQVMIRYPEFGEYSAGLIPNDMAYVRLKTSVGPEKGYFDDISLTPIQLIISSGTANQVNARNIPVDMNDRTENTGFRFIRTEKDKQILYRYRMNVDNKFMLREKFDIETNKWVQSGPKKLLPEPESILFSFNSNNDLPPQGQNTPLSCRVKYNAIFKGAGKSEEKNIFCVVYPYMP